MEPEDFTYTPWVSHKQGLRPVPRGTMVVVEMGEVGSEDILGPIPSHEIDWDYPGDPVVRYKVAT